MPAETENDKSDGTSTSNNGSAKRKRGVVASSRGVANLTPEQLERKRANDREAQRAIRERTKNQIEKLNDRIHELESSQPYQELQAVIAQKDAVQAENDEIKRQLASFITVFQRMVGSAIPQGLEHLAAAAEQNSHAFTTTTATADTVQNKPLQQNTFLSPPDHAPQGSPSEAQSAGSPASQHSSVRPYQFGHVQPPNSHRPWMATSNASFEPETQSQHLQQDLLYNTNDQRLGTDFLMDNQPFAKPIAASALSNPQQDESPSHYTIVPKPLPATCTLDAILLDAVSERQRAMAGGLSKYQALGPPYPNFNAMLDKNTAHASHPMSKLFTDILRTFPDLATLPERVAVIQVMYLIMRWKVDPSKTNYEKLPEWVRPSPSQLFTLHPDWIDYLPWPRLRDKIIRKTPHVHFDSFFVPYTTTLSLNWPYSPNDVLIATPAPPSSVRSPVSGSRQGIPDEPVMRMNPVFEAHMRDLRNWSLGPLFRDTFPEWADAVRIDDPNTRSRNY